MRHVTLYLLLAVAQLTATACSPSPAAPEPSAPQSALEAAASLVDRFSMGQGLRGLAYEAARGTTTYATQVEALGRTEADRWLHAGIEREIVRHQPQWDRNLAALYAERLSADELRSLARHGNQSPHAAKFKALQPEVAASMRERSRPVLEAVVTAALSR